MAFTEEQLQVVNHKKGNILISASAGSGKTTVMIERLTQLISAGETKVGRVLAVTFTEAAAADMKEKLKKSVINRINSGADKTLSEQLGEIGTADICTLHSFCSRLIRCYFFAAGVSPDYKIADQAQCETLKAQAVDKVFRELYAENDQNFKNLISRHAVKRSDKGLKALVLSLYGSVITEADPVRTLEKAFSAYSGDGFDDMLKEYKSLADKQLKRLSETLSAAENGLRDAAPKSAAAAALLIDAIQDILNGDVYAFKRYENFKPEIRSERKLDEKCLELKESVKSAREAFVKLCERYNKCLTDYKTDKARAAELAEHTRALSSLTERFYEIYSEIKREENVLDFNDLEHFSLKILKTEEILSAVRARYDYVFVDEYQDVNGVQEYILSLVSDGNAFMVGDEKQSIYGFRGCRPEYFRNKFALMNERGEKTVRLNRNFRSAENVINAVNSVFSHAMTKEYYGADYKTESLLSGGYGANAPGRVELHRLAGGKAPKKTEEPRIYDILKECRREESAPADTAVLIAGIIKEELGKQFYDAKENKFKPVEFGDIAVLTRNKSNAYVSDIVKGLAQMNVPVSSEVKDSLTDYPEIQVMICVLKLIDCFLQDIPLATVMKSPVGNFSDEELARISAAYRDSGLSKRGDGFCRAYLFIKDRDKTALGDKVRAFDSYFRNLRFISDFLSAADIMEKVAADSDMEAYLYAQRTGGMKAARLRRFITAAYENGRELSVREFLNIAESGVELAAGQAENAVKVMTIHSSKGLEFPVVIVCGLERRFRTEDDREEVLFDRDLGFAVKFYDDLTMTVCETPFRGLIKERARENRLKEELRLFYVAMTRAEYSLHLTFKSDNDSRGDVFTGADRFIDYIPKSLPVTVHDGDAADFINFAKEVRKVIVGEKNPTLTLIMDKAFSFRYPFEEETVLPLKTSVTALQESTRKEYYPVTELYPENDSGARERGIAAHRFMELYDFDARRSAEEESRLFIEKGLMTEDEISSIDLKSIQRVLDGNAFADLSGKNIYKEKSFLVNLPANELFPTDSTAEILVQGVIDLLITGNDGAVIFDYKYSALPEEKLKEKYAGQLRLYAKAAEKALKIKVIGKSVISLLTGAQIFID